MSSIRICDWRYHFAITKQRQSVAEWHIFSRRLALLAPRSAEQGPFLQAGKIGDATGQPSDNAVNRDEAAKTSTTS